MICPTCLSSCRHSLQSNFAVPCIVAALKRDSVDAVVTVGAFCEIAALAVEMTPAMHCRSSKSSFAHERDEGTSSWKSIMSM
ncbi:BQ5605_C014g07672 [Microbotryum silenes-dioicae]|uniref:BQ5605_C014g07672 protein n=1 Tax=Microbotryum silenes-dioicae TaxID=796604 RepID=A0A2X0LYT0_9BASI|nr:BQ5605_C014g07672 [Microbotryum silenes-dioicae]